jgi:hypothetical protein
MFLLSSGGTGYQIVPDQRVIPEGPDSTGTFRSIAGNSQPIFGAVAK